MADEIDLKRYGRRGVWLSERKRRRKDDDPVARAVREWWWWWSPASFSPWKLFKLVRARLRKSNCARLFMELVRHLTANSIPPRQGLRVTIERDSEPTHGWPTQKSYIPIDRLT